MPPTKVILISCGSYNPPTNMHLRMFEIARDHLHKMGSHVVVGGVISPVHDSYGKKDLASATHRTAMIKLALRNNDWIRASTWETRQENWTRTRQTLQYHQNLLNAFIFDESDVKRYSEAEDFDWIPENIKNSSSQTPVQVKLVCGADLLESFGTPGLWAEEDIDAIVGQHGLIVITRNGSNPNKFIYDSDLLTKYMYNICIVTEWISNEISSTKIRRALRRGESVKYLIPDPVLDYIYQHEIYNARRLPSTKLEISSSVGNDYLNINTSYSHAFLTPSPSDVTMDTPSPVEIISIDVPDAVLKRNSRNCAPDFMNFKLMKPCDEKLIGDNGNKILSSSKNLYPGQAKQIIATESGESRVFDEVGSSIDDSTITNEQTSISTKPLIDSIKSPEDHLPFPDQNDTTTRTTDDPPGINSDVSPDDDPPTVVTTTITYLSTFQSDEDDLCLGSDRITEEYSTLESVNKITECEFAAPRSTGATNSSSGTMKSCEDETHSSNEATSSNDGVETCATKANIATDRMINSRKEVVEDTSNEEEVNLRNSVTSITNETTNTIEGLIIDGKYLKSLVTSRKIPNQCKTRTDETEERRRVGRRSRSEGPDDNDRGEKNYGSTSRLGRMESREKQKLYEICAGESLEASARRIAAMEFARSFGARRPFVPRDNFPGDKSSRGQKSVGFVSSSKMSKSYESVNRGASRSLSYKSLEISYENLNMKVKSESTSKLVTSDNNFCAECCFQSSNEPEATREARRTGSGPSSRADSECDVCSACDLDSSEVLSKSATNLNCDLCEICNEIGDDPFESPSTTGGENETRVASGERFEIENCGLNEAKDVAGENERFEIENCGYEETKEVTRTEEDESSVYISNDNIAYSKYILTKDTSAKRVTRKGSFVLNNPKLRQDNRRYSSVDNLQRSKEFLKKIQTNLDDARSSKLVASADCITSNDAKRLELKKFQKSANDIDELKKEIDQSEFDGDKTATAGSYDPTGKLKSRDNDMVKMILTKHGIKIISEKETVL